MSTPLPKPPETIDAKEFRRQLAGLTTEDSSTPPISDETLATFRSVAIDLACIMAAAFGDELDRKTLWDRISTGLQQASAKSEGDLADRYVTLCMEHVKADPVALASHEPAVRLMADMASWDARMAAAFARYVRDNIYAIIIHARDEWQNRKQVKK